MDASVGARSTGVAPWQLVQLFLNKLTPVLSESRNCPYTHGTDNRTTASALFRIGRKGVIFIRNLPVELGARLDIHRDERLHRHHGLDRPVVDVRHWPVAGDSHSRPHLLVLDADVVILRAVGEPGSRGRHTILV